MESNSSCTKQGTSLLRSMVPHAKDDSVLATSPEDTSQLSSLSKDAEKEKKQKHNAGEEYSSAYSRTQSVLRQFSEKVKEPTINEAKSGLEISCSMETSLLRSMVPDAKDDSVPAISPENIMPFFFTIQSST